MNRLKKKKNVRLRHEIKKKWKIFCRITDIQTGTNKWIYFFLVQDEPLFLFTIFYFFADEPLPDARDALK